MTEATQSFEPTGPNPDYKPPKFQWNHVELIAHEGTRFGILLENDGVLAIAVAPPGRDFPTGYTPTAWTYLKPGDKAYTVKNPDRVEPRDNPAKLRKLIATLRAKMDNPDCPHDKVHFEGHFSLVGGYRCEQCKALLDPFWYHLQNDIPIADDHPQWADLEELLGNL